MENKIRTTNDLFVGNKNITRNYIFNDLPLTAKIMRNAINIVSILSPKLAGKLVVNLFQRPHKKVTRKINLSHPMTETYINIRGNQIITYRIGEGPKVLLVHGWASSTQRFEKIANELVLNGYQVIGLDLPSHGLSEGNSTNLYESGHTIQEFIEIEGPIHSIITHSFGGTATLFLEKSPEIVNKIITIGLPSRMESLIDPFYEFMGFNKRILPHFHKKLENIAKRSVSEIGPYHPEFTIKVPLHLIHDKDDLIVSVEDSIKMNELLENSTLDITQNLGHREILKDDGTIKLILNYLNN